MAYFVIPARDRSDPPQILVTCSLNQKVRLAARCHPLRSETGVFDSFVQSKEFPLDAAGFEQFLNQFIDKFKFPVGPRQTAKASEYARWREAHRSSRTA